MASAHEVAEHAEHVGHAAASNKTIALLISVFALFLAFSETLGKSAQTDGLSLNVEASNLWAFFQAKTIRMTAVGTAAEAMEVEAQNVADPAVKDAMSRRIESWRKTAGRYNDEPETGEGRKQLADRAKRAEQQRDTALAKYHKYEYASAAFQIAIVLASATVITGTMALTWLACGLGLLGGFFMTLALVAPHALHFGH